MKNRLLRFLNYKHRQFVKKRYGVGCIPDVRKLPKNEDLSKDSDVRNRVKVHFAKKSEDLAKSYIKNIGGRLV